MLFPQRTRKHSRHVCNLGGIPVPDILVKGACSIKHAAHIGNRRGLPLADILVKGTCSTKHRTHIGNLRGVPAPISWLKALACINISAILVTFEVSQQSSRPLKLLPLNSLDISLMALVSIWFKVWLPEPAFWMAAISLSLVLGCSVLAKAAHCWGSLPS